MTPSSLSETSNIPRPCIADVEDMAARVGRLLAPVFAEAGWKWRGAVPDAAQIAAAVSRQVSEVELEHTMSSGRIGVTRYVEDGRECYSVHLDVADAAGELP